MKNPGSKKKYRETMTEAIQRHCDNAAIKYHLSAREAEICFYLARCWGIRAISAETNLSVHTVKTHIKNVYAKLGVRSKAEAVGKIESCVDGNP